MRVNGGRGVKGQRGMETGVRGKGERGEWVKGEMGREG